MGSSQASRTVFVAGALLLLITGANAKFSDLKGDLYPRVFAIGVLTLGLAIAADWAPQLVVPFSAAVVVGFAFKNPGAFQFLIGSERKPGGRVGGPEQTSRGSRESGTGEKREVR